MDAVSDAHALPSEALMPGVVSPARHVDTDNEELALLIRASRGDRSAIDRLVKLRREWVARLARRYDEFGLQNEELESEAMIGLLESIAGYRGEDRPKFLKNTRDRISQRLERLTDRAQRLPPTSQRSSFREPCWDQTDHRVGELQVADVDSAALEDLAFLAQIQEAVPRLLAEMHYRDRRILCGRFGLAGSPITMVADLARELKMTCEAVSLGTDRLLRQLRDRLEKQGWTADMLR